MMNKTAALDLLVSGSSELGLNLGPREVHLFSSYLSILQLWGAKMNLTSRLSDRDIVLYHFLDSLSGARWLHDASAVSVVDLGSGAGFPSLPLKIAFRDLRVLLVESSRKKVSFCSEVLRATKLQGVKVLWGRGEDVGKLPEYNHRYDWAISRALSQAAPVARLSFPFLTPEGRILLYKGRIQKEELADLGLLCDTSGALCEVHPINVPYIPEKRNHIIVRLDVSRGTS